MAKICDNSPTTEEKEERLFSMERSCENHENENSNLILISIENNSDGLGIKLSKSSWDPYPFVSFVDETRKLQHDLQIGDCLLKVFRKFFASSILSLFVFLSISSILK